MANSSQPCTKSTWDISHTTCILYHTHTSVHYRTAPGVANSSQPCTKSTSDISHTTCILYHTHTHLYITEQHQLSQTPRSHALSPRETYPTLHGILYHTHTRTLQEHSQLWPQPYTKYKSTWDISYTRHILYPRDNRIRLTCWSLLIRFAMLTYRHRCHPLYHYSFKILLWSVQWLKPSIHALCPHETFPTLHAYSTTEIIG